MKKNKRFLLLLLIPVVFFSCRRDVEIPEWEVGLAVPLVHSSIKLDNIIPDSVLSQDADSLISLVYQKDLYSLNLDSFLQMPDTNYAYSAYLDSIKLGVMNIDQAVTLGQILIESGLSIFIPDGSTQIIPSLGGIVSEGNEIDASEYFLTMDLSEGNLDITLENQLPVDITNLVFQLLNSTDNSELLRDTFDLIPVGTMQSKTIDLAGKRVDGLLLANILNLDSPGSNGQSVLIDYDDALIAHFKVYNLKPYAATAIFPEQDLINKGDRIYFKLDEIALDQVLVRSGLLKIQAFNTIEDPVHFQYKLPGLTIGSDTFSVTGTIEAASNGQASVLDQEFDISGYNLNLQGAGFIENLYQQDLNNNGQIDGDTVNTVFVLARAGIDSTGHLLSLSLQDSFIFKSSLTDLIPDFGSGFLGRDTFQVQGESSMDFLSQLQNADVDLEDTRVNIEISNGIGVDGAIRIHDLSTGNSQSGVVAQLETAGIPEQLLISPAIDPGDPTVLPGFVDQYIYLDENNSNTSELLEIFPDKIIYDFDVLIHPINEVPPMGEGIDFIYYDAGLNTSLNVEIPLSLIAGNLNLSDTVDWSIDPDVFEDVEDGHLYFIFKNKFPLQAKISLELLGAGSQVLSTPNLIPDLVEAASLNPANGLSLGAKQSVLELVLDDQLIDDLIAAKQLCVKATFDSGVSTEFVRIYSFYTLDFSVSARFNYTISENE